MNENFTLLEDSYQSNTGQLLRVRESYNNQPPPQSHAIGTTVPRHYNRAADGLYQNTKLQ